MLRHVVVLKFREGTPAAEVDEIASTLRGLPDIVTSIRNFTVGRDLALAEDNSDLVIIGDFDDEQGYVAYRDDATHQQIIREQIRPVMASRAAAQFHI